jgi:membrane protein DedA with SNARE-associated domain
MATQLAQAHSGLAYGGVVVSVVIVAAFGATTLAVMTGHMSATDGQTGDILVGTLAAMASQVANYWLGSSQGSNAKNALLASAQNSLASSVPGTMMRSAGKD